MPPGNPPPFCGPAGHYKQLNNRKKGEKGKRKRQRKIAKSKAGKRPKKKQQEASDTDDDSDSEVDEESYAMEAIVDGLNSKGQYCIKWLDYDSDENTWEPPHNLQPEDIQQYLANK